ncbi:MAG TPA: LytR C-terminal domain-containing protein [Pseudonocardiaceae bacterium]|jgi:cytoskeletal protein RodZ|nr:LytR C-terminal domain-containing protein [Pseudonocardiaceae bacterium]
MQGMRPRRLAGFVLLGVAVIAVGLGVFALTSGNGSPRSQGRPPVTGSSSPSTGPGTGTGGPTTSSTTRTTTTPKPTTTGPTTTTKPGHPTTTIAPPPPQTTAPAAANPKQTVPVRVYNNGTIKDLAATAAADFRADGFNVVQVGNYSQGVIPTSTAYFTSLPGEKQVATELGHDFGMRVLPRFPGIAFASPGVIVIVTNDFHGAGK